jgi:hypothetical protein
MDFFEFVIALVAVGGTFVTIWVVVLYQRKEKKVQAGRQRFARLRPAATVRPGRIHE